MACKSGRYLTASTKKEFEKNAKRFVSSEKMEHPIIFEVFTDSIDESDGIYAMNHIVSSSVGKAKSFAKDMINSVAGEKGVSIAKKILKTI